MSENKEIKTNVLTKEMIAEITERLNEMEGKELEEGVDTDLSDDSKIAWYIAYKTTSAA